MAKRDKSSYKVGYGKPPPKSQFRPGQSGNPRGRPKGSRNFGSILRKVLTRPIKVRHNGAERRMPTQEAFANLIATQALGGDPKAMGFLIKLVDLADSEATDSRGANEPFIQTEDELVMASIVRRIRAMVAPTDEATPAKRDPDPTPPNPSGAP